MKYRVMYVTHPPTSTEQPSYKSVSVGELEPVCVPV